jgi:hypothetical protein
VVGRGIATSFENMRSAGSGTSELPFSQGQSNISNPRVLSDMGLAIPLGLATTDFEQYLKARHSRNIRQLVCYARRYHDILNNGDISPLVDISSGAIRRHVMEALTAYAKFSGCYDRWCYIRKCYSLHWTDGNESVQSLQRFFNPELSLDKLLYKIREMLRVLPTAMRAVVRHAVLTGLRPTEAIESVKLLNSADYSAQYYNQERQALEHFRFPELFIRATKKAFVSYITLDNLQPIRNLGGQTPYLESDKVSM